MFSVGQKVIYKCIRDVHIPARHEGKTAEIVGVYGSTYVLLFPGDGTGWFCPSINVTPATAMNRRGNVQNK